MKTFVNGFQSWIETYFEVVSYIQGELSLEDECCKIVKDAMNAEGYCSLYDLAEKLTDEFEEINKGREWDGEFIEEIDVFLNEKFDV